MSKDPKDLRNPVDFFPQKQEGKLNIYFHISENSGVGYYRQYLPAIKLREHNLANTMISDFRWAEGDHIEPGHSMLFDLANWADLIVVGRKDIPDFYAQWGGIRDFFNIPIVMDTDDNIHHVPPSNPGYQGYHPGADAMIWNKFGIAKTFDAITVTTQELKDIYLKLNPKIYILPNNLDMIEWNKYPKKEWNDGIIRIGFIASAAHLEGVKLIKRSIIEILKKHPNTKFLITHIYHYLFNDAPEELKSRIEPIPWIRLQEWQKGIEDLGMNIGIAPLTDNLFNRAKSNLRWLEYSAAKMASILSPVKPYLCVKHGKDGFLSKPDEWYQWIQKLVIDKNLRYTISEAAYQRINTEFNIDLNINLWENTYRQIWSKFHEYWGSKKIYHKLKKDKYLKLRSS